MCGRFTLFESLLQLKEHYNLVNQDIEYHPSYNIAPTQTIYTIQSSTFRTGITPAQWGFTIGKITPIINARKDRLLSNAVFSSALSTKRCLIPSNGFYEWQKKGNKKHPIFIFLHSREMFSFAGLYQEYRTEKQATIITTEANSFISTIHDRMPAILTREQEKIWLDTSITDTQKLFDLLSPFQGELECYEVSTAVNNVKNNVKTLIEPLEKKSLKNFL
jgi:putative SOS response-associated peptidase YedK